MQLPDDLLASLEGVKGFDRKSFINAHNNPQAVTSIRVNPLKTDSSNLSLLSSDTDHRKGFDVEERIPWCQFGFYLRSRPSFTFDPLFHAGCYYVQDASSMFLEEAFRQLLNLNDPLKVLDLCGAPGGKSTHILSLVNSLSLVVTNEVIRTRVGILADNIKKWGSVNAFVTNNDPSAFKKLNGYFDVIVVDAPCSGSGLFRKDEEAIDEWSKSNVMLCHQRQQRILADVLPCLKENGLLFYSTCSYSVEENEEIADWLVTECNIKSRSLQVKDEWNIVSTTSSGSGAAGYRFYPDKIKGEGFFLACFQKDQKENEVRLKEKKISRLVNKETEIINSWLKKDEYELIKEDNDCFLFQKGFLNYYTELAGTLNIIYKGLSIGEIMRDKLVPSHSLAMSTLLNENVPIINLDYSNAIKYLQRQDAEIKSDKTGWQAVAYNGHNLGWVNVLPNRVNNYYPKELRILKQSPTT